MKGNYADLIKDILMKDKAVQIMYRKHRGSYPSVSSIFYERNIVDNKLATCRLSYITNDKVFRLFRLSYFERTRILTLFDASKLPESAKRSIDKKILARESCNPSDNDIAFCSIEMPVEPEELISIIEEAKQISELAHRNPDFEHMGFFEG